ncbi:hypothetical protein ACS0PU_012403 [Formica fusca]
MEIKAINTRELPRERLPVLITHVESPLLFWVRLRRNESNLEKFEGDLNFQIAERIISPYESHEIKWGKTVAVKDEKIWRRGLITKIKKTKDLVEISLKDIGRKIYRPIHEVYKLEDRFKELPWPVMPEWPR